ncbi:hypothetical protein [Flavobacterium sp.]|uniref:hypothetical protein n=1 Tax=Flavobacterium sp. TaxID=239 RepID=UPI0026205CCF|nr:hypothetical protein [Flavobacterium sp.]
MEEKDYLKDIKDIKQMMSQSSQFLSLSGLSGILAGVYALIGAYFANVLFTNFDKSKIVIGKTYYYPSNEDITLQLLFIAFLVITFSIITGVILSHLKAKKRGEKLWNVSAKKLLVNFGIPLITGGIFALLLVKKEYYELIAPTTLLFYGLGCINASKNTFRDVRYLGITLVLIGLISTYNDGYGLLFWTLGFGVCHILYGSIMYFKYDRN